MRTKTTLMIAALSASLAAGAAYANTDESTPLATGTTVTWRAPSAVAVVFTTRLVCLFAVPSSRRWMLSGALSSCPLIEMM